MGSLRPYRYSGSVVCDGAQFDSLVGALSRTRALCVGFIYLLSVIWIPHDKALALSLGLSSGKGIALSNAIPKASETP
ncbi:hypothetical protein BvCmsHHP056_03918 [Escherichia coli]|nr:hypothetical protein BvCmsHHP056_03918 [Escherichia coli]